MHVVNDTNNVRTREQHDTRTPVTGQGNISADVVLQEPWQQSVARGTPEEASLHTHSGGATW